MREKAREELVCLLTGWTCITDHLGGPLARPELLAARIRGVMAARARRGVLSTTVVPNLPLVS